MSAGLHSHLMQSDLSKSPARAFSTVLAGLLAACACLGIPPRMPAQAQTTSARLAVRGCDTSKFPTVTCEVVPFDLGGVPITGLTSADFAISDKDDAVTDQSTVNR